jgi:hypothetical protein
MNLGRRSLVPTWLWAHYEGPRSRDGLSVRRPTQNVRSLEFACVHNAKYPRLTGRRRAGWLAGVRVAD